MKRFLICLMLIGLFATMAGIVFAEEQKVVVPAAPGVASQTAPVTSSVVSINVRLASAAGSPDFI